MQKYRNPSGGYTLRYLWLFRKAGATWNSVIKAVCKLLLKRYRLKYGLEIPIEAKIGKGLYLGHAFNITINHNAEIGDNYNIHKGVLIGQMMFL